MTKNKELWMARYKDYDYKQTKLIPVSFEEQILPGLLNTP